MSSVVEKMLRDLGYDLNPKKEVQKEEKVPRRPEGYETLISDEEFEAIEKIVQAVDDFIEVHNRNTLQKVDTIMDASPYARIQYTALSDMVKDVMNPASALYNIHHMDKKTIDECMHECGETDIRKFEMNVLMAIATKKMFG